VPYPVDYRLRDVVRLRAVRPDGERVTLAEGVGERGARAWLQTFWFDAGTASLRTSAGDGIAAAVARAVADDGATVRWFEVARRAHPENAMLLGWLEDEGRKDGATPAR
jgi:hypothetical protein